MPKRNRAGSAGGEITPGGNADRIREIAVLSVTRNDQGRLHIGGISNAFADEGPGDANAELGIPAAMHNSLQSPQEQQRVRDELQRGKIKLLYMAPKP